MRDYPYDQGNLLETPNTYFFSLNTGAPVLEGYFGGRTAALQALSSRLAFASQEWTVQDSWILDLWHRWNSLAVPAPVPDEVSVLMKRFAVTKRIWTDYTSEIRPTEAANSYHLPSYIRFSQLSLVTYGRSRDARFLNLALQAGDIVCAHQEDLESAYLLLAMEVLSLELAYVSALSREGRL